MKRLRWVALIVVGLAVAGLVVWLFWSQQVHPSVDRKVIDAYAQKGATYGRMSDYSGSMWQRTLNFLSCGPGEVIAPSSVPAFRFERFDGVRADELPGVGRPFGLDLSGTRVSDDSMAEVAKLDQLTHLDLSGTPVSDAGLKHFAGLTSLTHLSVNSTAVTDAGLRHLAGLTNLTDLSLYTTR